MNTLFTVAKTYPLTGVSLPENRNNNGIITSPRHVFTYIEETGEPLGVVSPDYQIMQPMEAYDLVAETTGNNNVETRWDGKRMIIQAPIAKALLPGDDEITTNFTVINSFDGSSSIYGLGINFRMFCMNQIRTAFRSATTNGTIEKIRHNGDFDSKLMEFRKACEAIAHGHRKFMSDVHTLVNRKVKQDEIERLWKMAAPHVLTLNMKDDSKNATKVSSFIQYATNTYESERERGAPDSMWLAANAVTKYIQHNVGERGRKPNQDRRYIDNAIGGRANLSAKVMRQALEMV